MRISFGLASGMAMLLSAGVLAGIGPASTGKTQQLVQKKTPYFGSIAAGKARMRTGPGRTYPASWLYRRADLPVKIIDIYEKGAWYKVEDPGGTQGWMQGSLVSETRTGIILGTVAELRDAPRFNGRIQWRVAPGVVGRLSKCARGWCYFDVRGRGGYVETSRLWGVDAQEVIN